MKHFGSAGFNSCQKHQIFHSNLDRSKLVPRAKSLTEMCAFISENPHFESVTMRRCHNLTDTSQEMLTALLEKYIDKNLKTKKTNNWGKMLN